MLIKPTLESLMTTVDSKYTLVTLAAKRARQLTDGDEPLVDVDTTKVVSIAWEEIDQGKITYVP
uniref:DNA-directed RNA polymerase subunit omega n=1 Tax=Megasphaera sp. TaxID=2023260 RepID=UPI00402924F6